MFSISKTPNLKHRWLIIFLGGFLLLPPLWSADTEAPQATEEVKPISNETSDEPINKDTQENTESTAEPQKEKSTPAVEKPTKNSAKEVDPKKDDKRKKHVIKLAEDQEEAPPPEKDPRTYELKNRRMLDDYTVMERRPYDRGEHILIAALMGAIGGGFVGGMVGLSGYDKNDEVKTQEALYTFGGIGAGVGVLAGVTTTFFERGKIEQFAIGRFLLKYSWYGALGGALIGGGIGLIPYASSGDYGDILHFAGYGAGVGLLAGITLFFVDLPDQLRLYTYQRGDQSGVVLALNF
ncbi:MAG: hypothetical protein LDLANPLL_02385 [Turneriella sp.]|nr:hypothetical protein [Turneriella sp.]